jgi:hypothetical protein
VYRPRDLWRTLVLVVALLLTAVLNGCFCGASFLSPIPKRRGNPTGLFHSRHFAAEKEPLEHIKTGAADLTVPSLH